MGKFDERDKYMKYMDVLLDLYSQRYKIITEEVEELEKTLGWTNLMDERRIGIYFAAKIELDQMAAKMKKITDDLSKL